MRVYRYDAFTSFDDLRVHDEPMPQPQRGEILVRVRSVSLNYRDIFLVLGNYVWPAETGHVPCSDATGEVVALGEAVRNLAVGDRVMSTFHPRWFGGRPPATAGMETYGNGADGWLAEYKAVSQEAVVKLPATLSWDQGATLPTAAVTAWNALSGPTPVRPGMSVLTLGTGGVSVFALQLAKALGATVVSTTSSTCKAELLTRLGADEVVNYRDVPAWGQHIKKTRGGVDCVVEVGGPGTINEALHAVRWGGEVVLIGFLTKDNPGIDYFHLKGTGAVVRAIGVGDRSMVEDLVRAVAGAGIKPLIDSVFPFADSRHAFEHMQNGERTGKIVIQVAE